MNIQAYGVFVILFGTAILFIYVALRNNDKQKASKIFPEYRKALESKDKALALELGRKYYSTLRGGNLTIYDEQAIANDLATIS